MKPVRGPTFVNSGTAKKNVGSPELTKIGDSR